LGKTENWHPSWNDAHGTWEVDFRVEGRRIRKRLDITDQNLKEIAVKAARNLYRESWNEALRPKPSKSVPTFAEAAKLYIRAGGEGRFLPRIVTYFGEKIGVDEIDSLVIAKAAVAIYPTAKPETVRRQLRVPIKAVQNFASGRRREKHSDSKRLRWLSPEEAERLLAAAARPEEAGLRDPSRHTLRKIAFMLGTGAGPGETMALSAAGWNPTTREWWLQGTKSVYRARFVLLPTRAVQLIGEVPAEGHAFVAPNGHPYVMHDNRGGQMAEAFRKIKEIAALGDDVVPYTLRHTWATWFYAQTKDWGALLDQGGWNRSDTANRYRKIAPSDLGNRLLAHGWDFRRAVGNPVRFGELVSVLK